MRILFALLIAATAFSQSAVQPEIRGTVREHGSNAPIAGAEVVLEEFVLVDNLVTPKVIATVLTNPQGEFLFKPGHTGNFYIAAAKAGHEDPMLWQGSSSAEMPLDLSDGNPAAAVRLALVRPGEITGRIVDGAGEPVAGLRITMEAPKQLSAAFRTDAEGKFQMKVAPGAYVIQTASKTPAIDREAPSGPQYDMERWLAFSEAEFQKVDEEHESLYWPGGVSIPDSALPMQVAPGSIANFGTITLRKIPAYRARVALDGECSDDEDWRLSVAPLTERGGFTSFTFFGGFKCGQDFLLRGLQPGKYLLAAWSNRHWSQTQLEVFDRNIAAKLTSFPAARIEGRVIAPEGVKIASLGDIHISAEPGRATLGYEVPRTTADAEGKFVLKDVLWPSQSITVLTQNPDLYVKQIRYAGQPIAGTSLTIAPGALLEINLDNNAAAIEGTAKDSGIPAVGTILLSRWPLTEPAVLQKWINTRDDGTFKISGLAPGEYRLVALASGGARVPSEAQLRRLLTDGVRIKIERGERKTLEVDLVDPPR